MAKCIVLCYLVHYELLQIYYRSKPLTNLVHGNSKVGSLNHQSIINKQNYTTIYKVSHIIDLLLEQDQMSQDWRIFAQGITASLRTQNGQNLAAWLQLTGSNNTLAPLGTQLQGADVSSLLRSQPQLNAPSFGPIINGMISASIAVAGQDFESGKKLLILRCCFR